MLKTTYILFVRLSGALVSLPRTATHPNDAPRLSQSSFLAARAPFLTILARALRSSYCSRSSVPEAASRLQEGKMRGRGDEGDLLLSSRCLIGPKFLRSSRARALGAHGAGTP